MTDFDLDAARHEWAEGHLLDEWCDRHAEALMARVAELEKELASQLRWARESALPNMERFAERADKAESQRDAAMEALRAVMLERDCAFCDSGKLRKRVDGQPPFHAVDCPWEFARRVLADLSGALLSPKPQQSLHPGDLSGAERETK